MQQRGETHDFIIVGGGIYGAAVAWELSRRGTDTLLLEAGTIASGASGGLGKRGVRANGRDVRELPLMRMAYELWPGLADAIGAPTGYERTGGLHLFEREDVDSARSAWASAPARQWTQQRHGIPTELLNRAAVMSLEPALQDEITGALYCPLDGIADHTATTRGLAQAAQHQGAEIREHTPVADLEREDETVTAVISTAGERIGVRKAVLLLSNTHVPHFVASRLGVTLPAWTMLPQVLLSAPLDSMPVRHLIGHESRVLAIKVIDGTRIMISGGWHGWRNPVTGVNETISEQVRANVAEAIATYPSLEGITIEEADASRSESVTVDGIPIIDRLPGARNMLIGTGWSGHGFAISLAVARLLSDWVERGAEQEPPELLCPFSYSRFMPTGQA